MRILITGGQGYIGTYLTKALLDLGHTVVTLDSCLNSITPMDLTNYNSRLIRHQASTANPDAVARAMSGVDLVYHLAARNDWNDSPRYPLHLFETNVQGTVTVLSMARKVGVTKVIFASSSEVYGNLVGAEPTDPCVPITMFGASKLAAEAVCRGFYQLGMDVIIARIYNVWGRKGSKSVVNKFANGCNTIRDDGLQTRDFVFIDDVIKALIQASSWDSNIYNIASGDEVAIAGLYELIKPGMLPTYEPATTPEIQRSCGSVAYTPWKPEIKVASLTREAILSYC